MAQILMAYGANIHMRNSRGQTIIDVSHKDLFNASIFQDWVSFYFLSILTVVIVLLYILS